MEEVIYDEEIPIEDIEEAVDEYVNAMSLDDLLTYVRWNMKDYYVNVADFEEAQEFLDSNRDTSVYVEEWAWLTRLN